MRSQHKSREDFNSTTSSSDSEDDKDIISIGSIPNHDTSNSGVERIEYDPGNPGVGENDPENAGVVDNNDKDSDTHKDLNFFLEYWNYSTITTDSEQYILAAIEAYRTS